MRRTTGLLILLVLAGLLWSTRYRPEAEVGVRPAPASDPAVPAAPPVTVVTFDEADCDDAGYLCSGLALEGTPRALRWPDGVRRLRIHVPLPEGVPTTTARELQRQVAAGIREWRGRPLELHVETSRTPGAVDAGVRWVRRLEGDRIGEATLRWQVGADGPRVVVTDFALRTHTPDGRVVEPRRIRLTAAHEMGHILGLPHSDDPADVMYPYNTATRLTYRDFRTAEVLYSLPAGARLERAGRR